MSNSVEPHRRQPTRLPHPWDSPGKNTGGGCHFFLQCMKVKVKLLSRVQLLATPWTAAYQAPLSMGFSSQEYWSGLPLPPPNLRLGEPKQLKQKKRSWERPDQCKIYFGRDFQHMFVKKAVLIGSFASSVRKQLIRSWWQQNQAPEPHTEITDVIDTSGCIQDF